MLTVAQWNIEHDGGEDAKRWELAHDVVRTYHPEVFLRQEMTRSHQYGHRRLHEAEHVLGLRGFITPATPENQNATGLFLDPHMFNVDGVYPRTTLNWHPVCNVVAYLEDCPRPISFASFHLCFYDAETRLTEARRLTTLTKPGMVGLLGGDCNSYPRNPEPRTPLPDWDTVSDRAHMVHGTYLDPQGHRHSDTRPDTELTAAGYIDLARHAADHLGQPHALAATAGHDKPEQGGPRRTDRAYAFGGLAAALDSVEVIDTHETRAVSKHSLVLYLFHEDRLRQLLKRTAAEAA
ncbi:endonuclease/exonuclease/phosphatase family protein [Streptomyces sp. NPDC017941]|uniref:endonuclease/exonuclease/phosphatase family protein n=1 Tax=Streptomyces sp. NPDC017941 TaxID=3365018 RepID=UPI003799E3B3